MDKKDKKEENPIELIHKCQDKNRLQSWMVLDKNGLLIDNNSDLSDGLAGSISSIAKRIQQISKFLNSDSDPNNDANEDSNPNVEFVSDDYDENQNLSCVKINIKFKHSNLDIATNKQLVIATMRDK